MADDLGWNDVGYRNPKVKTPHLDALRAKGIELIQSYATPQCSMSRAALLTGRYPSNTGLQVLVLQPEARQCLPIEHKTLYEYMKDEGYTTKHLGKWHMGYCDGSCLPESRGIDEFRGVLGGTVTYFNWTTRGVVTRWVNGGPSIENIGTHLAIQDQKDAREMILDHKNDPNPLFMWITPTAPHDPLETTEEMFNVHDFLDPSDPELKSRREYLVQSNGLHLSGLVSAFDDVVGVTMTALCDAGMEDNTIIVFSSDNGGADPSTEFPPFHHYANNYPLRNGKTTFMEGGVRVPTIYYDPRLRPTTRGTSRDFLMHITDWLPTFVQLAKPGPKSYGFTIAGIDGVSQLPNLGSVYNLPTRRKYNIRKEMLVALTDQTNNPATASSCATEDASYRWKNYKLIYGDQYYVTDPTLKPTSWVKPQESPELPDITGDDCHRIVDGRRVVRCLFNVIDDPSETTNLYDQKPGLVARMLRKIDDAKRAAVQSVYEITIGATNITTQPFGNYIVPRHDYCIPSVDFPLEPIDPICY
ncbi:arylsulfatase B-like [Watersipora subatra]|uniref:arylsulfatase B-like n=1 Tax=Watersipora subatra TaxID=2589382 RepID=UPI00355B696E